jgi:hypothetical protein
MSISWGWTHCARRLILPAVTKGGCRCQPEFAIDRGPDDRLYVWYENWREGCDRTRTVSEPQLLSSEEGRRALKDWRSGNREVLIAHDIALELEIRKQDRATLMEQLSRYQG